MPDKRVFPWSAIILAAAIACFAFIGFCIAREYNTDVTPVIQGDPLAATNVVPASTSIHASATLSDQSALNVAQIQVQKHPQADLACMPALVLSSTTNAWDTPYLSIVFVSNIDHVPAENEFRSIGIDIRNDWIAGNRIVISFQPAACQALMEKLNGVKSVKEAFIEE